LKDVITMASSMLSRRDHRFDNLLLIYLMKQDLSNDNSSMVSCVVVGDQKAGKSCLVHSYSNDSFKVNNGATVFDHFYVGVEYTGKPCKIEIWDLSGAEDHISIRKFAYSKAHIILLCFSITDHQSFESVSSKWLKEIRADEKARFLPILLIGCKSDGLCEEGLSGKREVGEDEINSLVERENLLTYCKTSALLGEGVKAPFDEAVRMFIAKDKSL